MRSEQAINQVMERSQATGAARLTLIALARHCNHKRDDLAVWPSLNTLARLTRTDKRTVGRSLKKLCDAGEIIPAGRGARGTVVYRLALLQEPEKPEEIPDEGRQSVQEGANVRTEHTGEGESFPKGGPMIPQEGAICPPNPIRTLKRTPRPAAARRPLKGRAASPGDPAAPEPAERPEPNPLNDGPLSTLILRLGLPLLAKEGGDRLQARSLLNDLCLRHGEAALLAAVGIIQREQPEDPEGRLRAALEEG